MEDAEFSPFFEGDEINNHVLQKQKLVYQGGTVQSSSGLFKFIMITLLVVFIVYLLFRIFTKLRFGNEDYNQRKLRQYFNNTHGEAFDEEAKQAIEYGEAVEEPRAIDHYRLGTVYLVNANNPVQAHRHFNQALRQIIDGLVDVRETPYILDRIGDFRDHFFDFPDIEELPLQRAVFAHFEQQNRQVQQATKEKKEIAKDDPEFTQKVLISRQIWNSDSQNVHDAAIYETLKDQYIKVRDENAKIPNIQLHGYDEAVQWLKLRYDNDDKKKAAIDVALATISNNYPVGSIPNTNEKDILTALWQRTYDPENASRAADMREAIADSVVDCVEGGNVVCMSGRSSKVWQALAKLDKDESMGVLKTKQAIRNEIYEKAAKVVDDYIGTTGSASDILKKAYTNNEDSEQVKELTETIKKEIDKISDDYNTILPKEQLTNVIEECKAMI